MCCVFLRRSSDLMSNFPSQVWLMLSSGGSSGWRLILVPGWQRSPDQTGPVHSHTLSCVFQGQKGVVGKEGFVGRPGPRAERGLPGLPGERGAPGQKVTINDRLHTHSAAICAFMLNPCPFPRETRDCLGTGEPRGSRVWSELQVTRAG